jgi:hypothetical protein
MKPHQLGMLEFSTKDEPLTKHRLLCNWTMNLNGHLFNGDPATLRISQEELYPDGNFQPKLKPMQIMCLWLITEGTVFPNLDGLPGWRLAELFKMEASNLSRDLIVPLEKMDLIYYETRATTKPNSSHPNKRENAYYIKRISMRSTFNILLQCFEKRYHNHLIWDGVNDKEPTRMNCIAGMRFSALALLQKKLDEYENSSQFYIDRDVKPPSNLPKR